MEAVLHDLAAHNIQNRTVALVENGSWAPTSGSLMKKILEGCKNMRILEQTVSLRSSLKEDQLAEIDALVDALAADFPAAAPAPAAPVQESPSDSVVEPNAFFKFSYGLFVLTAKDGDKDNGCIINTLQQLTDTPKRITIAVNKQNYTHDMIVRTGVFNVSILTESVPFKIFQQFGFKAAGIPTRFLRTIPSAGQPTDLPICLSMPTL